MADPALPGSVRIYTVSHSIVEETVQALRATGQGRNEAVALWVGQPAENAVIDRLVVPRQQASMLHFNVPLAERLRLVRELTPRSEIVLVQLHTHPEAAFHSDVDDRLAIPQHIGGISIVIPRFALDWHGELESTSVNVHIGGGRWRELDRGEVRKLLRVSE